MKNNTAYIDELTGVYNRRYLTEKQNEEIDSYISDNSPFSIVMVDIDHFKEVNDTYGHIKGDQVIKDFAQFLKTTLRIYDKVIRYGGDEFICIMPSTSKNDAEAIYRRILKNCKEREFDGLQMTLSAGISSYPDDGMEFKTLLNAADQALYDAKRSGRDRIGLPGKKTAQIPIKVFVNRFKEKNDITNLLRGRDKNAKVVVIEGNVGIGKTRLAKEILSDIKGKEVIWCDCIFLDQNISYYPIRELIKYRSKRLGATIFNELPRVYKIEIAKLVPEILLEVEDATDGIDYVLDRYRLYESVRTVLEIGEREKVIIIDNIQWIDNESVEVMKYLMRALKDTPITFILIQRTEEKPDILENFISHISREVTITITELTPFENHEIKESIKLIIGDEPANDLVDYIMGESGGNPFFIEEIMRSLFDAGYLSFEENKWRFASPEKDVVPKTLADIAVRKYQSLNEEAKNILEIASVIGWFDINLLMEITGYNAGHIMGLIDNIGRLGMVKYSKHKYEFSEAISRNAIYQSFVKGAKRLELHRQVAECLKEHYQGKEEEINEALALHYYLAKEKQLGIEYCITAGDRARDKYANNNAIRYYTWALELLEHEAVEPMNIKKIDCLCKRADVIYFIGESQSALKDLDTALKEAIRIDAKTWPAWIKHRKANIYAGISRYQKALSEAADSMETYKKSGDKKAIAEILITMSSAYFLQGNDTKAIATNEESLKLAREIKNKEIEATALNGIGGICFRRSDYEKASGYHQAAYEIFKEIGNRSGEARALLNMGNIHYSMGEYADALKRYEESLNVLQNIGDKINESKSLRNLGLTKYFVGKYEEAIRFYKEGLKIERNIGNNDSIAMILSDLGDLYVILGQSDAAKMYLEEALSVSQQTKSNRITSFVLVSLADLYLMLNERQKAKEYLDKAYKISENSVERLQSVLPSLCNYYLEEKDFKNFNKTFAQIKKLHKKEKPRGFEADTTLLNACYLSAIEDYDKAEHNFQKVLQTYEEIKELLNTGKTHYYWGIMELRRERASAAKQHLTKALKIFKSLNAKGWEKRVLGSLR